MRTSIEIIVALLTSLLASGTLVALVLAAMAALAASLAWWLLGRRS
ncbi:MAG: hypothetical protein K2X68_12100 [Novosphingobium sp.]|nr:hypothetical protein [Novosphingobium sp.]